MANPGFYNDNQYRDYPFVSRITPLSGEGWDESSSQAFTELPQGLVVDFGAIVRPAAEFDSAVDYIHLRSIARAGDSLLLTFTLSSMSSTYAITFTVDTPSTQEFVITWADSIAILETPSDIFTCDDTPVWSAYLVTSDTAAVLDMLDDGDTVFFEAGLWQILPARIQNLIGTQLQSIAIANISRTLATQAEDCAEDEDEDTAEFPVAHLVAGCITGGVTFHEGYNCGIRYDSRANAIVISASPGIGAGQPCGEVIGYPAEAKPSGSQYYSGGPACTEVLRSVNGASAADLRIQAGAGFSVVASTEFQNTLVIERLLNAFVVCTDATLDTDDSLSVTE
jgi:hypothetical protein